MADKWDKRFLDLAAEVARWSKDPSSRVGAVLADSQHRILGLGYNGLPRGVTDDPELLSDRPRKYEAVVHAELNAVLNARASVEGATLYCTHPPCGRCAAVLIQAGVSRVVYVEGDDGFKARAGLTCDVARRLLTEAGVEITEIPRERIGGSRWPVAI